MLSSIEKISLSISFGYQNKIFYAWHGRSRSRSIDNILCASNIPNWIYFSAFSLSLNLLKFTGWILIDVSEIHFMENNRVENLLEFYFPSFHIEGFFMEFHISPLIGKFDGFWIEMKFYAINCSCLWRVNLDILMELRRGDGGVRFESWKSI